MKINYSFIIPHKNCPDLLQRCVDSIPERDDVQIIVVDDNSDADKKPSLKSRKDLQVILLDATQSKGAGRARNVGMEYATGKWLLFADSDDFLHTGALEEMDREVNSDSDIIFFKIQSVNSKTLEQGHRSLKFNEFIDNFIKHRFFSEGSLRYIHSVPWGKMICRSFIAHNRILFDEVRYGNDVMFSLRSGMYAKKISVSNGVVYIITEREGSLVTQINYESLLCRFDVSLSRATLLCKKKKYLYLGDIIPNKKKIIKNCGREYIDTFFQHAQEKGYSKLKLHCLTYIAYVGRICRNLLGRISFTVV